MRALVLLLVLFTPAAAQVDYFSNKDRRELFDETQKLPLLARTAAKQAALMQAAKQPLKAAWLYGLAMKKAPQSWALPMAQGAAYLEGRDGARALESFRRAAELNPKSPLPRRMRGIILEGQEKFSEAEAEARAAVSLDPKDARARALLGMVLRRQKRYYAAIQQLEIGQKIDPTFWFLDLDMAMAYNGLKRYEEAEMHFNLFLKFCGLPADHPAVRKAREMLAKIQRPGPGDGVVGAFSEGARDALLAGWAALRMGDYPGAEANFRAAVGAAPRLAEAWAGLGQALGKQKRIPEALAAYTETVALSPNNPRGRVGLAYALEKSGRKEEALNELARAIKLAPGWAEPFSGMAIILYDLKRYKQCAAAARQAIALDPDNALIWSVHARMLRFDGDLAGAVEAASRAQNLSPLMPHPDLDLGLAYKALGRTHESEYHLKSFLRRTEGKMEPDDPERLEAAAALSGLAR